MEGLTPGQMADVRDAHSTDEPALVLTDEYVPPAQCPSVRRSRYEWLRIQCELPVDHYGRHHGHFAHQTASGNLSWVDGEES